MTRVPSLNYDQVIRALRRDGWIVVRQRGSHNTITKIHKNGDIEVDCSCPSPHQTFHFIPYPEAGRSNG